MVKKCIIPNCKIQSDDPGCIILGYRKVPANQDMQDKWLSVIKEKFGNSIEKEFQKKYSYVCDLHFPEECFYFANNSSTQRLLLQRSSCPSVFINFRSRASQYVTEKYDLIYKRLQLPVEDENCTFESDNSPIKIELNDSDVIVEELSVNEPETENSSSQDKTLINKTSVSISKVMRDINMSNSLHPNNFSHIFNKKFLADVNESEIDFKNEVLNKKLFRKYKAESTSHKLLLMKYRKEIKNLRMQVSRYKSKVKNSKSLLSHIKEKKLDRKN